jgi:hypothetical protein
MFENHGFLKMNAEESLSVTPPQIRQIAQKTLENLQPEKSQNEN